MAEDILKYVVVFFCVKVFFFFWEIYEETKNCD